MLLQKCFTVSQFIAPRLRNFKSMKMPSNIQRNFSSTKIFRYCDDNNKKPPKNSEENLSKEKDIPTLLSSKFEIFSEDNAPVILDMEEERQKLKDAGFSAVEHDQDTWEEEFREVDLTRGEHGVFDVKQLVDLLQSDGALDTFVVKLPEELRYAEHLVIVTGRSGRHRHALAQLVRRIYKKKRLATDVIPRIEGDHVNGTNLDWIAMDLGNIVLHIFARASREKFDLESLWSLGSKHDVQCNKPEDPLLELLNSHSVYLGDLEPAEPSLKPPVSSNNNKNSRF